MRISDWSSDVCSSDLQRDEGIVRQIALREGGFGDAEFSLRYQFNRPVGQKPIFVGTLRVKSDTGKGPFEIGYDEFGVATGLATRSEEHTSELQSLMRISYAVFCLKKKNKLRHVITSTQKRRVD